MAELTECQICLERYNKTNKMPKILSCGHTFCKECLTKQKNKYNKLQCSICREVQETSDPEKLITNRAFYDLLYIPKEETFENSIISENPNIIKKDSNNISFKIIMIGPSFSGKTCLVRRFVTKKFSDDYKVTVGFDFMTYNLEIEGKTINLQLWDTAGTEMFQSLTSSYYRNCFGALVVFDVGDRKSFNSLDTWIKYYRENRDKNMEELLYLVGNKIDIGKKRVISKKEAEEYMEKEDLKNYFEASAKTGDNVDKIFNSIGKDLFDKYIKNKNKNNIIVEKKEIKLSNSKNKNKNKKKKKC